MKHLKLLKTVAAFALLTWGTKKPEVAVHPGPYSPEEAVAAVNKVLQLIDPEGDIE